MIKFNEICSDCGASIPQEIGSYSFHAWGRELCMSCQQLEREKLKGMRIEAKSSKDGH